MTIGEIIRGACHSVVYLDANGNSREVWSGNNDDSIQLVPNVFESGEGWAVLSLTIQNIGKEPVRLCEGAVLDIYARRGGALALGGDGNSWTMLTSPIGAGVTDLCEPCHEARKRDYSSADYTVIGSRRNARYALLGFLGLTGMNTRVDLKLNNTGFAFERLRAVCDFSGAPLYPGESRDTEPLYVNTTDGPKAALAAYIDRLVAKPGRAGNFQDIIGWATWDYYQAGITEQDIIENLQWLSDRKDTLPVSIIQLDHGFEPREGDWLATNEQFPHGLRWLADAIRAKGYTPGLWMCPFLVAPECEVYCAHPDWAIQDAGGSPLTMRGYAVPEVYGLDCSIPDVLEWLRELGRRVTVDFGFRYIKLDGANGQILSELGRLHDTGMTLGAAAHQGLAAFREGMHEDAFLLNTFHPRISIGLCDGMRIGDDVGGRWDALKIAKHHGERDRFNGPGEVLRSIAATLNHFYFHKKTWVNDPDYLVVRQEGCNSELSYEEARTWASVVGLSNGLVMLSDNMPQLQPERVELLEKVLPHYHRAAEPADFFEKNVPSFYVLDADCEGDAWKVVCVLNPDYPARTRDYSLPLSELGLSPDREYCVFDFWNRQYRGTTRERLTVEALAPHDCRVLRLTEASDTPRIIGTDIHISMGGLEIKRCVTNGSCLKIKLSSIERRGNLYIRGPDGWMPCGASPLSNGIVRVPVTLDGTELVLE